MRVLVFETLSDATPVTNIVGVDTGIYGAASLEKRPERVPFLCIHMGNESAKLRGGDPAEEVPKQKYLQLWAHDEGGDYLRIEELLDAAREALELRSHSGSFLEARWIERSRDLRDPDFNTLTKYDRYTIITSR